jgi:hypothetical protein
MALCLHGEHGSSRCRFSGFPCHDRDLRSDNPEKNSSEHTMGITAHPPDGRRNHLGTGIGRVAKIHRVGSRYVLAVNRPGLPSLLLLNALLLTPWSLACRTSGLPLSTVENMPSHSSTPVYDRNRSDVDECRKARIIEAGTVPQFGRDQAAQ